jgi:hydroxymethylglutaryl-CoA reductase (NADPH)
MALLQAAAQTTTRHGRLVAVEPRAMGREVLVTLRYETGDAHGMNMITKATDAICTEIMARHPAQRFLIFSGLSSEKHASGYLFNGGKGKKVTVGARIPARVLEAYLHVTPAELHDLWQHTMLGHCRAVALGQNGHLANGLAALFIACGQDVANVVNSAMGLTHFEVTENGDLYASLTLTSLTVATVGGGVDLGTSAECLSLLDCRGSGKARKFAEITAAMLLAGELSFSAAIASGEFVAAHESYGRNRPKEETAHQ